MTGYEFSSKNHFAIFKLEENKEIHYSGYYPSLSIVRVPGWYYKISLNKWEFQFTFDGY